MCCTCVHMLKQHVCCYSTLARVTTTTNICDEFDNSLCIFVRHKLFPFYTIVFCSYIMCCVYSFMFYLFFVCNVFHSESKWNWKWIGTWKWKYDTHNCATSAHHAWAAITHQEIAQHKGCYFGRHSKSTPMCATSAHRFLQCTDFVSEVKSPLIILSWTVP